MLLPVAIKYLKRIVLCPILLVFFLWVLPAYGGGYLESAHGNAEFGVNRSAIDPYLASFSSGNCAHCHEQHASLEGSEPGPVSGASPHLVFSEPFNVARTQNPYQEADNFCFYCHSETMGQQVVNRDYSTTFGGGDSGSGPQSIFSAFNQASYHNLSDIYTFLATDAAYSSWFAEVGNPCSGCHDSHLAKRNWDSSQSGFPLLSSIRKPGASNLWGESEVMSATYTYEAPFATIPGREPANFGDADGTKTPDFVGFCTSCHNLSLIAASTNLSREIRPMNWDNVGMYQNKHGAFARDGSEHFREPYATASALKTNFSLSCLDCHESHGSPNIMLLRTRVNGEPLEGTVDSLDTMSFLCKRCHADDLAAGAGTGEADRWEFVHHGAADAPYAKANCLDCHATADPLPPPVACGNCHGHGMDDSWAGANQTGRVTF